jgi:hypothetical protein
MCELRCCATRQPVHRPEVQWSCRRPRRKRAWYKRAHNQSEHSRVDAQKLRTHLPQAQPQRPLRTCSAQSVHIALHSPTQARGSCACAHSSTPQVTRPTTTRKAAATSSAVPSLLARACSLPLDALSLVPSLEPSCSRCSSSSLSLSDSCWSGCCRAGRGAAAARRAPPCRPPESCLPFASRARDRCDGAGASSAGAQGGSSAGGRGSSAGPDEPCACGARRRPRLLRRLAPPGAPAGSAATPARSLAALPGDGPAERCSVCTSGAGADGRPVAPVPAGSAALGLPASCRLRGALRPRRRPPPLPTAPRCPLAGAVPCLGACASRGCAETPLARDAAAGPTELQPREQGGFGSALAGPWRRLPARRAVKDAWMGGRPRRTSRTSFEASTRSSTFSSTFSSTSSWLPETCAGGRPRRQREATGHVRLAVRGMSAAWALPGAQTQPRAARCRAGRRRRACCRPQLACERGHGPAETGP